MNVLADLNTLSLGLHYEAKKCLRNPGLFKTRIDLKKVSNCTGPASRLYIAERYHRMHINSGTMLLIDPAMNLLKKASDEDLFRYWMINNSSKFS